VSNIFYKMILEAASHDQASSSLRETWSSRDVDIRELRIGTSVANKNGRAHAALSHFACA
jgi:hypothetical protein